MIKHSKAWAEARGLVQKSPVHGEDEWRIPTMRSFKEVSRDKRIRRASTSFTTQASVHVHINSFVWRMTLVSLSRGSAHWTKLCVPSDSTFLYGIIVFETKGRAVWQWCRAATTPHRSADEDEDLADAADQPMPLQKLE